MALIRSGLTAAVLFGYVLEPAITQACAGPVCLNDQFLPRDGTVPANITAIAWDPGYNVADDVEGAPKLPRLDCIAADGGIRQVGLIALPEDRPDHLELRKPLVAGERCTLQSGVTDCSVDSDAEHLQGSAQFEVTESRPIPDALGLLAIAGPTLEDVEVAADASCSENALACVLRTSVVFEPAALPWKDALLFETLVDGERFSTWRHLSLPDELGGLYGGRDAGAIYVLIPEVPENVSTLSELAAGEHTLSIRAHLPGSDVFLATPEVTVNLDCGRATRTPTATSNIVAESDGCTVAASPGSAQRRAGFIGLCFAAALLVAGRRRMRMNR